MQAQNNFKLSRKIQHQGLWIWVIYKSWRCLRMCTEKGRPYLSRTSRVAILLGRGEERVRSA